jgi:hypothetical protein
MTHKADYRGIPVGAPWERLPPFSSVAVKYNVVRVGFSDFLTRVWGSGLLLPQVLGRRF